jgi:transcriptional regulator with XRE-family HTH domain
MIKNEHQYQVTKSWVNKFQEAIVSLHQNEDKKQKDPEGWQLIIDSYFAQIKNLLNEIVEYENLVSHNPETPLILSTSNVRLDDIGDILIKVRIAKKITEKELAILINATEEQIKEYEKNDYQNASFDTILEVADALGVKLQHCTVVSEINDFTDEKIMKVRQAQHIDNSKIAASRVD